MATSIKKRLFISLTPPATVTLVSYQALPFVQIGGIVSLGSLGFSHATIEVPEIETGITRSLKGARAGQAAQVSFATVIGDAGQAAVAAADEGYSEVSLMIVNPDGVSAEFWTGIVHSLIGNESNTTSFNGAGFTFVPNYPALTGAPALGGGPPIGSIAAGTVINLNTIIQEAA